ncbi:MAG: 1,2-phenylacetyl-CoA epoxidase subunit PaaD [Dermatophilaceae bacterium]
MTTAAATDVLAAVRAIPDPEIPVVSISDLGILRELSLDLDSRVVDVVITPTYSGCPAMQAIQDAIVRVCRAHGLAASVRTRLLPPWTTDWIGPDAREQLRQYGIAPPGPAAAEGPVAVTIARHTVACPRCGSTATSEIAHFGSTACKALRRCEDCGEPFDEFKAL